MRLEGNPLALDPFIHLPTGPYRLIVMLTQSNTIRLIARAHASFMLEDSPAGFCQQFVLKMVFHVTAATLETGVPPHIQGIHHRQACDAVPTQRCCQELG